MNIGFWRLNGGIIHSPLSKAPLRHHLSHMNLDSAFLLIFQHISLRSPSCLFLFLRFMTFFFNLLFNLELGCYSQSLRNLPRQFLFIGYSHSLVHKDLHNLTAKVGQIKEICAN